MTQSCSHPLPTQCRVLSTADRWQRQTTEAAWPCTGRTLRVQYAHMTTVVRITSHCMSPYDVLIATATVAVVPFQAIFAVLQRQPNDVVQHRTGRSGRLGPCREDRRNSSRNEERGQRQSKHAFSNDIARNESTEFIATEHPTFTSNRCRGAAP